MAFHGQGAASIAHTLIREKVPTPGWLNYSRYGKFANIYAAAPDEKRYAWTIAQVKTMLKDETYIGNAIRNKQTNISYKNKKPLGELSKAGNATPSSTSIAAPARFCTLQIAKARAKNLPALCFSPYFCRMLIPVACGSG